MNELIRKLSSRKLWLAVAGLIIAVINDPSGIDLSAQAQAALAASPLVYIVSEAIIDILRELRKPNV